MRKGVETRLDGSTLIVRIPMRFQRRGSRKRIVAPDGSELAPATKPQPDVTLVKALARAWRWQHLLDDGDYGSVSDIGEAENISKSYVSRILRLAMLAPDIVEAILAGRAHPSLMLEKLERPLPTCWAEQRGSSLSGFNPKVRGADVREVLCGCRESNARSMTFHMAQDAEFQLLFLGLCFRRAGLRFSERARRSAGRRENLLLVSLGLLGLAVAPLLPFRHRRTPSRSPTRSPGQ